MSLPLLVDPGAVQELIKGCVSLFQVSFVPPAELSIQIFGAVGTLVFVIGSVWDAVRGKEGRLHRLGEVAILLALFAFLHPLPAVGIYYLFWHSSRHLLRLSITLRVTDRDTLTKRFREAIPVLAATTIIVAALLLTVANLFGKEEIYFSLVVLICCLTLPHTLVTDWMDRAERVAYRSQTHKVTTQVHCSQD